MILVTGASGFVGRRLVARLAGVSDLQLRVLLHPRSDTRTLPKGVPIHIMTGKLDDGETLVAAMNGVHTIFHLVGTEMRGRHAQLQEVDIVGAEAVIEAALATRVGRIIYVSRIGAERGSAFPVLRTKGIVEEAIRSSGLAYTIFRTGVLFGAGDRFGRNIASLASAFPVYFVPGDGEMNFQPLWVEDLVSCLAMSLEDLDLIDRTLSIGGPEILTYRRAVMRVMHTINRRRPIMGLPLLVHSAGAWFLDGLFAGWPFTQHWIELLSTNQTGDLGTLERHFGIRPAAFDVPLLGSYLKGRHHSQEMLGYIFTGRWRA